jgi:hypothetical protein
MTNRKEELLACFRRLTPENKVDLLKYAHARLAQGKPARQTTPRGAPAIETPVTERRQTGSLS